VAAREHSDGPASGGPGSEGAHSAGQGSSDGARSDGAVTRALRVLEALSPGARKLAEIAEAAGVTRTNAHRILGVLTDAGYVQPLGGGSYRLAPRSAALGAALGLAAPGGVERALRELGEKVGATVHLALRSGSHAVYVHKIDAPGPVRMASSVGMRISLHCTAIGKAMLAALDDAAVRAVVAEAGLPVRTPNTIGDVDALAGALAEVRALGHAVDDEENEQGIRCLGMALPRDGAPGGGISISTLTYTTPRDQLISYRAALADTVDQVAALLA
jgi:IclR family transcriptional regulator, acetate operon repressor